MNFITINTEIQRINDELEQKLIELDNLVPDPGLNKSNDITNYLEIYKTVSSEKMSKILLTVSKFYSIINNKKGNENLSSIQPSKDRDDIIYKINKIKPALDILNKYFVTLFVKIDKDFMINSDPTENAEFPIINSKTYEKISINKNKESPHFLYRLQSGKHF
jgi:hypothetical protein